MKIKEYLQLTKTHLLFDAICEHCKNEERIRLKIGEELPKCSNCKI